MSLKTVEYDSMVVRRRPKRLRAGVVVGAIVVLGMIALGTTSVRQTRSRVDSVTGSVESMTIWRLGITVGPRVDVSPLERRLRRMGVTWTPNWCLLHNTHRTVLGNATCYECGSAPPIYQLRPALDDFVQASSDAEIRGFVSVMQNGTEVDQRAAVDAAAAKVLVRADAAERK
jgi:hypothetical protein